MLGRQKARQIIRMDEHQIIPAPQNRGPLLACSFSPIGQGTIGRVDGTFGLAIPEIRDRADQGAVCRIQDVDSRFAVDPCAIDKSLRPEQFWLRKAKIHVCYFPEIQFGIP